MQITYLSDMMYSTDFVYALIFLTFLIWLVLKMMMNHDNMGHALVFALLAMVFLPFIFTAAQIGPAFIILALIGGLVVSQTYKWPISTSIVATLIALMAGALLLPSL
ncbi:MAG: hypothetical protein V1835_00155 [Candidatus Micrarchaeota archaeon]